MEPCLDFSEVQANISSVKAGQFFDIYKELDHKKSLITSQVKWIESRSEELMGLMSQEAKEFVELTSKASRTEVEYARLALKKEVIRIKVERVKKECEVFKISCDLLHKECEELKIIK